MSRNATNKKLLNDAIDVLASMYDGGHLLVASLPADFIGTVAEDVARLRSENAELLAALKWFMEQHGASGDRRQGYAALVAKCEASR